jgi:hydrogenase maturation protease
VTDPVRGPSVLVIGYGSELRRDDAAGRHAAEQVAARGLPDVRVQSVTQLAPEHAADIAGTRLVVFVDASIVDDTVSVRTVEPTWPDWRLTHHLTPAALLGLAQTVCGAVPRALVVTIPISDAALGLSLSARAAAGVREAVGRIVELCAAPARPAD